MPRGAAILIVAALFFGFATPAPAAEHQSHYALAQTSIDTYILPRIAAFAASTDALAKSVSGFCAMPSDTAREPLKVQYREALMAWAEAEIVRIGPVTQEGRAQRIAFWPDARGAVARQVKQALARSDPALADRRQIAAQSAAVQGFPALEMLLAETASPIGAPGSDGTYRCKFAAAIAANLATVAHDLVEAWTKQGGWRDRMLRPGSDNTVYPSATTAAADVLKSITISLQIIIEAELKPLAEEGKRARSFSQPYKRLALSRDYLIAGIRACRALYETARLDSYLDPHDPDQTAKAIRSAFDETLANIASDSWMAEGRDASAHQEQARVAASKLSAARRLIATNVANAAEISLGFNELDGD